MTGDFITIRKNIEEWKQNEAQIGVYFQKRETALAKEPMVVYTKKFVQNLFLLNHQTEVECSDIDVIKQLERKPLNVEERLGFVMASPTHYHAYIQLKELFAELEKLVARYKVLEKRK